MTHWKQKYYQVQWYGAICIGGTQDWYVDRVLQRRKDAQKHMQTLRKEHYTVAPLRIVRVVATTTTEVLKTDRVKRGKRGKV